MRTGRKKKAGDTRMVAGYGKLRIWTFWMGRRWLSFTQQAKNRLKGLEVLSSGFCFSRVR